MNDSHRDIPWINSNLFTENRNKIPYEDLLKYAGQYVGWSMDGTRILASGADELEMEQRLKELGIDGSRVVGEYILPTDVTSIL